MDKHLLDGNKASYGSTSDTAHTSGINEDNQTNQTSNESPDSQSVQDNQTGCNNCIQRNCEDVRTFCGEVKELIEEVNCGSRMKKTCTCQNFLKKFPILQWAPKYRCPHFQGDLIAGLTVGLTVIPQGLAYAQVAELSPEYGLYAAFMGCFIYMFFGTSKDITLGPTAIMSLMVAEFNKSPIPKDPTYAIVLSVACGVMQLVLGLLSLGFLVDFLPYPVINAFTTSAAITIAVGQVKKWLGLHGIHGEFLHQVYDTCRKLPETYLPDFGMGLVVMIVLWVLKRIKMINFNMENASLAKIILVKILFIVATARNALVIAVAAGVAAGVNENETYPFTLTGNITGGMPKFGPPKFHVEVPTANGTEVYGPMRILSDISFGLFIVPIMGVVESVAIGNAFARKNNYKIDSNQELIAIGASNLVGAFAQSYPVTGSFSRTAVNSQSGVKTPAGGLFTGGLVLLALGLLTPLFYYIPDAALAGVIIVAVLDMATFYLPKRLWKIKKMDLLPWFVTFIFSFVLGIEYGIILGVLFSLLFLLCPWSKPNVKIANDEENARFEAYNVSEKDVCVIQIEQGMRYPGVEFVRKRVMKYASDGDMLRSAVFDCTHVSALDYSAVQCIQTLVDDFKAKNAIFVIACANPNVEEVLKNAEIKGLRYFDTVGEALQHIQEKSAFGVEQNQPLLQKPVEDATDQAHLVSENSLQININANDTEPVAV